MPTPDQVQRWSSHNVRTDGLRVRLFDGCWVIDTGNGARIDHCPCCGSLLHSAKAAKLVADFVFALPEQVEIVT